MGASPWISVAPTIFNPEGVEQNGILSSSTPLGSWVFWAAAIHGLSPAAIQIRPLRGLSIRAHFLSFLTRAPHFWESG